jgi:uncharacterized protein YdeI (YjbR/CyaY-like superfamily)
MDELWVGYYKKATGRKSITWTESVREALCYGWIDGLRKSIDEKRYRIRFTPRRTNSNWSDVNITHVKELITLGKMEKAGILAFEKRKQESIYSFEQEEAGLLKKFENEFRSNTKAWKNFNSLAPSIKKKSIHWVMSAKKDETRLRRLGTLIKSSEKNQKVPQLIISKKKQS